MPRVRVALKAVKCIADGKRFTTIAGVRAHFRKTGHETFKNVVVIRKRVIS